MKRLARGRYQTPSGHLIENDSASMGEWDEMSEPEWFIYPPGSWEDRNYGPPEALTDGFATLREARAWLGE